MSCTGYLEKAQAEREYINKLKIVAVIQNVTVEELAAMMQFLREYRKKSNAKARWRRNND